MWWLSISARGWKQIYYAFCYYWNSLCVVGFLSFEKQIEESHLCFKFIILLTMSCPMYPSIVLDPTPFFHVHTLCTHGCLCALLSLLNFLCILCVTFNCSTKIIWKVWIPLIMWMVVSVRLSLVSIRLCQDIYSCTWYFESDWSREITHWNWKTVVLHKREMLKIIGKAYGNILNPHDGFSIYVVLRTWFYDIVQDQMW